MREVADAYKKRSIHEFERIYGKYKARTCQPAAAVCLPLLVLLIPPPARLLAAHAELADDPIVFAHLDVLKANLLEQNLTRLIEPFSKVQIAHVAKLIDLPRDFIEAK